MTARPAAIRVRPGAALRGTARVPGDKSLSHRVLILGALAEGASHVRGWLPAGDTLATLGCVEALGVAVERADVTTLTVRGRGLDGLRAPAAPLSCGHAGTAMRLLAGVLAGQPFASTLDGSDQLRRRPGVEPQPVHDLDLPLDHRGAPEPAESSHGSGGAVPAPGVVRRID